MAKEEFRQRLANIVVKQLEENDCLSGSHWIDMTTRPFNPVSGTQYKGGNVLNLMWEQAVRGSDDPRWMTLKQANQAGYRVRVNSKAAYAEYWDWTEKTPSSEVDENGTPVKATVESDDRAEIRKPKRFMAVLYNGQDIVGLPKFKSEAKWQPGELVEKLIAATGAKIEHHSVNRIGNKPDQKTSYFSHVEDKIVIPPRESFSSEGNYHATLLHELAHWTGHHSRLERRGKDEKRRLDSPEYAKEELRAELASLYLTSMLGVDGKVQNHTNYAKSWRDSLQSDKHELFRAARDAEQIVTHILDYAPELREVVESKMADNLLSIAQVKPVTSGIDASLPNFIPPESQTSQVTRYGREDPRWMGFDQTVRREAKKFSVDENVVENALSLIEHKFSEVMNAADKNGYSADDMNDMLARSIVSEMRTADERLQQWDRFCAQVHKQGQNLYTPELIDLALQEAGARYQQIISTSMEEGWTKERTDNQIRSLIYGVEGRRPITAEFVKQFISNGKTTNDQSHLVPSEDEDDFVLIPLGLSDVIPNDCGAVSEERLFIKDKIEPYLMHDAEIAELATP